MEPIANEALMWESIAGILGVLLPIAVLLFWKKQTKCKMLPAVVGALIFLFFAQGLELIPKMIFFIGDTPLVSYVRSHSWAYVLIGCLQAGIFEETGRYVAFRFLLKKYKNKETAVTYGLGHGGLESLLILGVVSFSSVSMALFFNSGALSAAMANMPAAQSASIMQQLTTMAGYGAGACFIDVLERILALLLHISLSVVVFSSVWEKRKGWLFPAAILLHAVFDIPAALYQCNELGRVLTELLLAILAGCIAYVALRIYRGFGLQDSVREEKISQ